jgi:hypothetical protein
MVARVRLCAAIVAKGCGESRSSTTSNLRPDINYIFEDEAPKIATSAIIKFRKGFHIGTQAYTSHRRLVSPSNSYRPYPTVIIPVPHLHGFYHHAHSRADWLRLLLYLHPSVGGRDT